jgi:hypothetical protein
MRRIAFAILAATALVASVSAHADYTGPAGDTGTGDTDPICGVTGVPDFPAICNDSDD